MNLENKLNTNYFSRLKSKALIPFMVAYTALAGFAYAQKPLVFPQYADGGGFRSEIVLTNTSNKQENGTINFKDDNGNALPVSIDNVVRDSLPYSIQPGGTYRLKTDDKGNAKAGYVTVVSNNADSKLTGNLVFDLQGMEVSVPNSPLSSEYHVAVERNQFANSGIAIAYLGGGISQLTFLLLDESGNKVSQTSLNVPSGRHSARYINEIFSNVPNDFKGSVHVISENNEPFALVGLRQRFPSLSLSTLSGSASAYDPSRVKVTANAVDVVNLANLTGTTTFYVGDKQGKSENGRVSFWVEPNKKHEVNYTNSKVFDEWLLVRNELNGNNLEKRDITDLSSAVLIDKDMNLYLIKINNDFVGDKTTENKEITKDYFTSRFPIIANQGFTSSTLGIAQFVDPMNILSRYRNLTTDPDSKVKANYFSVIDIINTKSRRHKIIPKDGGTIPISNYIDVMVNNEQPSNGSILNGNVILNSTVQLLSDTGRGVQSHWDVVFEEIFEATYHVNDSPFRAALFPKVNISDPIELTRFGKVIFYTLDEFPAGTQFKIITR